MNWKTGACLLCGVVLGGLIASANWTTLRATEQQGSGHGLYTVVETQGTNLLVTDNKTNTLYYYTIDKDKEIGSDLKLRGSIDLTQVGKPEIHLKNAPK